MCVLLQLGVILEQTVKCNYFVYDRPNRPNEPYRKSCTLFLCCMACVWFFFRLSLSRLLCLCFCSLSPRVSKYVIWALNRFFSFAADYKLRYDYRTTWLVWVCACVFVCVCVYVGAALYSYCCWWCLLFVCCWFVFHFAIFPSSLSRSNCHPVCLVSVCLTFWPLFIFNCLPSSHHNCTRFSYWMLGIKYVK